MNAFADDATTEAIELHAPRPRGRAAPGRAHARACAPRATRTRPSAALARVREAARGTENLLPPLREALAARCTVGEICGVLREEWGTYDSHLAP